MLTKHYPNQSLKSGTSGYTLVELAVVLAGLSILTTISLTGLNGNNGILSWKKRADIDGTKALLNATAADCLQKSRLSGDTTVDDSIISNEILEPKGYEIDPENNTCTSFGVKPINDAEALLFPKSFAIVRGKLTKSGQPTGADSIPYCKSWAGILCSEGEELKKLVEHVAAVQASKDTCNTNLAQKKANKMTGGPVAKWNPYADSNCPTRPPVDTSSKTCTIDGCKANPVLVWLVEGVEYTSKADADAAEAAIAGANCILELNKLLKLDPTLTQAKVQPRFCTKKYYFAEGKRFDNETAWKGEMCSIDIKKKQDTNHTDPSAPNKIEHCANDRNFYFCAGEDKGNETAYQACLIENKSASCEVENNKVRENDGDGKHTNTTEGPSPCGKTFWVCDKTFKDTLKEYEDDCEGECVEPNEYFCSRFGGGWCICP